MPTGRKPMFSEEIQRSITQDYASGANSPELARRYGCSGPTIMRIVHKAGVNRTNPEAQRLLASQRHDRSKVITKFWEKVDTGGGDASECWRWTANRYLCGYGMFWDKKRCTGAHRFAWEITNGPIPEGLYILHRCDNKICVNPSHLFLGTAEDNVRDAIAKGRFRGFAPRYNAKRGSAHGGSKLNEWSACGVLARCLQGVSQEKTAKEFGVSQGCVKGLVRGKSWAHLFCPANVEEAKENEQWSF